jgi:hypothetical protein
MKKYCGTLRRVGGLGGGEIVQAGRYGMPVRTATHIDVIQIDDEILNHPRCTSDVYQFLDPGRKVCLYIFHHLFYKPVIIGVKSEEDGTKYTIGFRGCFVIALQYFIIWPVLLGIPLAILGGFGGEFLGTVFNIHSVERPEISAGQAGSAVGLFFGIVVAVVIAWLNAVRILSDYFKMKVT